MLSAQKANAAPSSAQSRMRSRLVIYAAAVLGVLAGVWLA